MVFIGRSKSTREEDLEKIAGLTRKLFGSRTRKILLDRVYRQAKDSSLEEVRKKLIEALKRGNLNEIYRLEKLIKRYFPNEKYQR